jgi:glycosyltransferase involved in cell wall biosynthesis
MRFLAWCAIEGRRQYAILRSIPEWDTALAQPFSLPTVKNDHWSNGFSVDMFFYGIARHRYFIAPMLRDAKARHRIARAFWRGERHKFLSLQPSALQIKYFEKQFGSIESLIDALRIERKDSGKNSLQLVEEFGLTDILESLNGHSACNEVTSSRPYPIISQILPHNDLDSRNDINRESEQLSAGQQELLLKEADKALQTKGLGRFYVRLPVSTLRLLALLRKRCTCWPSQFQLAGITSHIQTDKQPLFQSDYPFGVNLYGYVQGEIGIGEDVRSVARALKLNNIPCCIVNVKPGDNVSQKDNSVDQWIVEKPLYAINIFCTTGIEQVRYACERGLDVFEGRYNIGFWPWELPIWPVSCEQAFSMVDEIWGISSYTASAYRRAKRPVYVMSLPVTIDSVAAMKREDFDLPEDDYLFVFSFDFNSTLARKNPVAVICAFQRAYPVNGRDNVGLVLKASHVNVNSKEWKRIKSLTQSDPRIHVIDETLRRPEVLALYQCCDCYVSLHRAEGFGRGLAEALLLDLQLIATGFSGNLDFCKEGRVGLVKYRRRNVRRREYFHADGQSWADPDVVHAAELMRSIRANPRSVEPRMFDFSPAAVGRRYARRLSELKLQLNLKGISQC